jgi:threonine/homoserine/homoserine lactone efflux protein
MAWAVWLAFFGAAIAISVSPGAGAIQSMATGLTQGVRRGYWSILGLEIGLMLQLALVVTMVTVDLVVMGLYAGLAARLLRWLHTPRQQTRREPGVLRAIRRRGGGAVAGAAGTRYRLDLTPERWS